MSDNVGSVGEYVEATRVLWAIDNVERLLVENEVLDVCEMVEHLRTMFQEFVERLEFVEDEFAAALDDLNRVERVRGEEATKFWKNRRELEGVIVAREEEIARWMAEVERLREENKILLLAM